MSYFVQYICMAEQVLQLMLFPVERLCRIHMSVVLAYEIRLSHLRSNIRLLIHALVGSHMRKVVVGINVLQETSLLVASYAAGLSARIQLAGQFVGSCIEFVVIHRLVDPYAPEYDGRMISVLLYHLPDIFHSLILPCRIAYMLPARDLREYHKSYLLASVYKVL